MTILTLTDYINKQLRQDKDFANFYAKEKIINDIAEMVVMARKEARLTQQQLAEKSRITQSMVARIESGNGTFVPSLETLSKIAFALNMDLQLRMDRE